MTNYFIGFLVGISAVNVFLMFYVAIMMLKKHKTKQRINDNRRQCEFWGDQTIKGAKK